MLNRHAADHDQTAAAIRTTAELRAHVARLMPAKHRDLEERLAEARRAREGLVERRQAIYAAWAADDTTGRPSAELRAIDEEVAAAEEAIVTMRREARVLREEHAERVRVALAAVRAAAASAALGALDELRVLCSTLDSVDEVIAENWGAPVSRNFARPVADLEVNLRRWAR